MEYAEYQKLYELEDTYWWFVGRRRLVTELIRAWMPRGLEGPILDVGCGTGGNLVYLQNWGPGAGLDLSPLALDFARRRELSCLAQASALDLPYASDTFGLVTAFDVLYHRWVTSDASVVRECFRILRPGGWLLVIDAALPSLWSEHDEVFHARQRYTLDEIGNLVTGAGFSLRKLTYANSLLFPAVVAFRWLGRCLPRCFDTEMQALPGPLNLALTKILNLEASWLRRGTFPVGSSGVCLAQKT